MGESEIKTGMRLMVGFHSLPFYMNLFVSMKKKRHVICKAEDGVSLPVCALVCVAEIDGEIYPTALASIKESKLLLLLLLLLLSLYAQPHHSHSLSLCITVSYTHVDSYLVQIQRLCTRCRRRLH